MTQLRPLVTGLTSSPEPDVSALTVPWSSLAVPFDAEAVPVPQPLTKICLCNHKVSNDIQNRVFARPKMPMASWNKKGGGEPIRLTFNASLREKLLSQWAQGNGFTAKWILLWRLRS